MKVHQVLPSLFENFDVGKASRTLKYSLADIIKINKIPGIDVNAGADLVFAGINNIGRLFVNYGFYLDDDGTLSPEITDSWVERDGKKESASYVDIKVIDWLDDLGRVGRSNPKMLKLIRAGIEVGHIVNAPR